MPRPGMFTQGHVEGLTNELAAQITEQVRLSDKVALRHPYSAYNEERVGAFFEQRPPDFSTHFGYGFPLKVFDRNSAYRQRGGDAPFPPGFAGHVPEKAPAIGETFGQITKAKVDSNMALRPASPVFQSMAQKTYLHPRDAAARSLAPPQLVRAKPPPPRHYDPSVWQTSAQASWHAPPASAYLPPRLRVNEMDEYGEVVPTERTCAVDELPKTKPTGRRR